MKVLSEGFISKTSHNIYFFFNLSFLPRCGSSYIFVPFSDLFLNLIEIK